MNTAKNMKDGVNRTSKSLLAAAVLASVVTGAGVSHADTISYKIEQIRLSSEGYRLHGTLQDVLRDGTFTANVRYNHGEEGTAIVNALTGRVHHVSAERGLLIASSNIASSDYITVQDLRLGGSLRSDNGGFYDLSLRSNLAIPGEKELARVRAVGAYYDYFTHSVHPFSAAVSGGALRSQVLLNESGQPAQNTFATKINARGQIAGHQVGGFGTASAVVWSNAGAFAQIVPNVSYITDLNDAGQFVGVGSDGVQGRGYFGRIGGQVVTLADNPDPFAPNCLPQAISAGGEVIGGCTDGSLVSWKQPDVEPNQIELVTEDNCNYTLDMSNGFSALADGSILAAASVTGSECPQEVVPVLLKKQ